MPISSGDTAWILVSSALVLLLGRRKGFPSELMEANNIPMVALGAGLLWFGWFGFNAGGSLAANAFVTTSLSVAAAGFTWIVISWLHRRPSLLGTVTGAVAGLVAITPVAGFVTPLEEHSYFGMTVSEVSGRGKQRGIPLQWRVGEYRVDVLPKLEIELVVLDEDVSVALDAIVHNARTSEVGDGKIFVLPVKKVIRVRTGDSDEDAI
jgi:nitrogen regulatory protein PII